MAEMGKKLLLILAMMILFLALPLRVQASSAVIQFTTADPEVQKGDIFTVVCQVTSSDSFLDTEFQIEYDTELVQFLKGGSKVTGGNGILTVSSVGNESLTNKKTFSLQFVADKKGSAVFQLKGTASIRDEEGNSFSSSSNQLVVNVNKKKEVEKKTPAPTAQPVVTPEPALSDNNKLKSLSVDALDFTPEFNGGRDEYTASVDNSTKILYISFRTEDDAAKVQLKGNEKLKEGVNKVQILVTAQNGSTRTYQISVTRETAEETAKREGKPDSEEQDFSFYADKKGNKVTLKNSYEFEVLDPSGLKEIPAGYILSGIEVEGVQIPAFTMENDLDNNYLLMYLKGPAGESGIYQYDRREKTLQRYTGSMIEKVNKSEGAGKEGTGMSVSNFVLLGIIAVLVILILCMLITMLKMAMKRKEEKNQRSEDYDEERFYR